jgi:hypothetical protein
MSVLRINLRDVLLAENARVQRKFLSDRRRRLMRNEELQKLVVTKDDLRKLRFPHDTNRQEALRILGISESPRDELPEEGLPAERIVHFDAVRRICMDYGLVFRPFREYKGQLAKGVAVEVLALKALLQHDPIATRFFIAAPTEMFCDSLSAKDPFLFYEVSPDEYYLVHQWGMDTSPLRLLTHWPRGTPARLLAARTALCLFALIGLATQLASPDLERWAFAGMCAVTCAWVKFLWDFKHKRGVHERHWFHP